MPTEKRIVTLWAALMPSVLMPSALLLAPLLLSTLLLGCAPQYDPYPPPPEPVDAVIPPPAPAPTLPPGQQRPPYSEGEFDRYYPLYME